VHANRDQIFQDGHGGMNERAPIFDVPPCKATPVNAGFHGDAQILMHGDEPIDVGILVKIRALHCNKRTYQLLQCGRASKANAEGCAPLALEKIARPGMAEWRKFNDFVEFAALYLGEHRWHDGEAGFG
jgi:hypothetical protein